MKKTIVILHGWSLSGDRYQAIKKIFEKKNYSVFVPDLPGFGKEKLTKKIMYIDDYIEYILDFLKKNDLKKIILIGHSFGARIGAKLAAKYPGMVEKLILTGAPLIKQKISFRKKIILFPAKAIKKIFNLDHIPNRLRKILYSLLGEWDYYKADNDIKETFKAIIAEDIAKSLSFIRVPTLVIWGEKDKFVPKSLGNQITKKIANSNYVEIPDATHKLPYEKPEIFAKEVLKFIG